LLKRHGKTSIMLLGCRVGSDDGSRRLLRLDQARLCCLAVVTIALAFGLKLYIACRDLTLEIPPGRIWDGLNLASLGRVLGCCAEDFAVILGCLLVGLTLIWVKRATWYRRTILVTAAVLAMLAICYMVINVQVFHILRRFINYSLFLLAGGFNPEQSVDDAANLQMRLMVAIIPLLALAAYLALFRYLRPWWQRLAGALHPLTVLALVLVFAAVAYGARKGVFSDQPPGDFARNPHLHLAKSYFARLTFGDVDDVGDIDPADFEPGQANPGLQILATAANGNTLQKRPKNVVLIVLESMSKEYLQIYGYPSATTPQLCALQDRGIVFDNFYSNSTHTLASSLTLQASLYNDTREWNTFRRYPHAECPWAASWLKSLGYRTYFLGARGEGVWCQPDCSIRYLSNYDLARTGDRFWSDETRPWPLPDNGYRDDDLFADAQKCIDDANGGPFFLMMWNYATHFYYQDNSSDEVFDQDEFPAGVFRNDETVEEYIDYLHAIHNTDRRIGNLYRYLQERGLAEDTLVIITGDHGEAWGQHGKYTHGHALFEEDVHVPLIFLCPSLAHLGPRRTTVGSHVDLWPTIADVLGVEPHPQWQGRSLFAPIPDSERRTYFSRVGGAGVREGRYKYIWDNEDGLHMLFDLDEDPGEKRNLAASKKEYCEELHRRLRDWTLFQQKYLKSLEP
jgi:lipoteichoic acid synthase